ncbi:hypothetical protein Tco_0065456 [Tanacetum coccineum]
MALTNEGFDDIRIQYMGELWVLLGFASEDSKKLFHDNVGAGSWFSQLKQASMEFNSEGRIVWVEIEGIPFKLFFGFGSKKLLDGSLIFLEESEDEDESDDGSKGDSDVEEVLETLFEERGQNNNKLDEASTGQQENHSEDPFSIYTLLKKKKEIAEKDINI